MKSHSLTQITPYLALAFISGCGGPDGGAEPANGDDTGVTASTNTALVTSTLTYSGNDYVSGAESPNCNTPRNIYLVEPDAPGPYPVFLYTGGSWENYASSPVAQAIVQYAAQQGFVAAFVEYRNDTIPRFCSDIFAPSNGWYKAQCAYSSSVNPSSATAVVCARAKAGCSTRGIVTAGFSQGGYMAASARNFDTRVRGAWTMGVVDRTWDGFDQPCLNAAGGRVLSNTRLRVIRGVNDWTGFLWTTPAQQAGFLNRTTGRSCAFTTNCLNGPNQSGWYLVPPSELNATLNPAAHCFQANQPLGAFGNQVDCVDVGNPFPDPAASTVDPTWARVPPATPTFSSGMYRNVQWLKNTILPLGNQL